MTSEEIQTTITALRNIRNSLMPDGAKEYISIQPTAVIDNWWAHAIIVRTYPVSWYDPLKRFYRTTRWGEWLFTLPKYEQVRVRNAVAELQRMRCNVETISPRVHPETGTPLVTYERRYTDPLATRTVEVEICQYEFRLQRVPEL